jgi:DNA polymerase-1
VLPAEREQAKRMVYGITYGMGPVSLGDILGVTKREAKSFMDTFLSSYPSVQQFVQTTIQNARRDHVRAVVHIKKKPKKNLDEWSVSLAFLFLTTCMQFVRTMFGRRRVLDVESQDEERRADRQAVNAVIQGTAADIVKLAMLHVEERIRGTSANLLLQIHDVRILKSFALVKRPFHRV